MVFRFVPIVWLVGFAYLAGSVRFAQADLTWQFISASNWATAGNWNGGVPNSGSFAYINNGGTALITTSGATCYWLYLGQNAGQKGSVNLSGSGQLATQFVEYVGYSGTGSFTQSGGTHSVSDTLYVGVVASGSGAYNLTSGLLTAHFEEVGNSPTAMGSFTQSGGTNSVSLHINLGDYSGSYGAYSLSGSGLLMTVGEAVGLSGTGSFTQAGGTNSVNYLLLGQQVEEQRECDVLSLTRRVMTGTLRHFTLPGNLAD
jgi:hypothetical protein